MIRNFVPVPMGQVEVLPEIPSDVCVCQLMEARRRGEDVWNWDGVHLFS